MRRPPAWPRCSSAKQAVTTALAVHQALQRQPMSTSESLVKITGLTAATLNKSLAHLQRLDVVQELTNRKRGRIFSYRRYVAKLRA
jgi:cell filamentation protein, protein adenylyltransferase